MNNIKLKFQELTAKLIADSEKLRRYSLLSFIIFVSLIYGFLLFRINSLSGQQPTEAAINKQIKAEIDAVNIFFIFINSIISIEL